MCRMLGGSWHRSLHIGKSRSQREATGSARERKLKVLSSGDDIIRAIYQFGVRVPHHIL